MPRNSDMVRSGQAALPTPEESPTQQTPPSNEGGAFSGIPNIDQPQQREIKNFPVFSQLYNEIGTIAEVVEQINRISDFISGRPVQPPAETQARQAEPAPAPPRSQQEPAQQQQPPQPQPAPPQQPAPQAVPEPTPQQPLADPAPVPPPIPEPAVKTMSEEDIEYIYEELYQFVEGVMQAAQEGRAIAVEQGFILISKAVDTPSAIDVLYRRAIYTRESEDDHGFASSVVLHSANVSIYAIKIGQGLGYNRNQLIDLGVAALLHDVGMVTLPSDLFTKGKFTQRDIEMLQQHPIKGRAILSQLGPDYQWLADVAFQEHEREDGSGYPQALSGNQIHEYAKIVGVADIYAGLTRYRPDRRGMLPFEAVKEILQNRRQEFDQRVVRILLKTLSAFPVGSLVKLNSGAIGRVMETDVDSPLRPIIEIMYDPEGRAVQERREIRLREHPILHIAATVDPAEIGL